VPHVYSFHSQPTHNNYSTPSHSHLHASFFEHCELCSRALSKIHLTLIPYPFITTGTIINSDTTKNNTCPNVTFRDETRYALAVTLYAKVDLTTETTYLYHYITSSNGVLILLYYQRQWRTYIINLPTAMTYFTRNIQKQNFLNADTKQTSLYISWVHAQKHGARWFKGICYIST